MRNSFESTGIVVRRSDEGSFDFLGSCFALLNQKWFLTAAHVVGNLSPREDGVGLFLHQPVEAEEGLDVRRIHRHATADLAVIELDLHEEDPLQIFDPFGGVSEGLELGDDLMPIGFPTQSAGKGVELVPRMLRGHVQRRFLHTSPYGFEFAGIEVSFSAPAGMSGSPVSFIGASISARGNFLNFLDLRRAGSGGSQPDSSLTSGV